MSAARVALVTYAGEPSLTADDQLFQAALRADGIDAQPVNWDSDQAWESFDAIVIRSPWDYYKRFAEYSRWLDRLEAVSARVFNPTTLLRWNSNKIYLRQLDEAGILVPPTAWVTQGETVALADLMQQRHWEEVVVKPTVSATAYHTYRMGPSVSADDQRKVDELCATRDVMIQPYLSEVASAGELSLLFFDGRFSHAVLKRPKRGDFRVQSDFGGTVEPAVPGAQIVAEAARVLAAAPARTLYARVDGCVVGGHFMLMELEVVEPCLFFKYDSAAASRMVTALKRKLVEAPAR
jgi:glutathione synthase/RimK-type ligase-like ATP-grasp enzyme